MPNIPTDLRETGKQQVEEGPEGGRKGMRRRSRGSERGRVQKAEGNSQKGEEHGKETMERAGVRRGVPAGPVCSSRGRTRQRCWVKVGPHCDVNAVMGRGRELRKEGPLQKQQWR